MFNRDERDEGDGPRIPFIPFIPVSFLPALVCERPHTLSFGSAAIAVGGGIAGIGQTQTYRRKMVQGMRIRREIMKSNQFKRMPELIGRRIRGIVLTEVGSGGSGTYSRLHFLFEDGTGCEFWVHSQSALRGPTRLKSVQPSNLLREELRIGEVHACFHEYERGPFLAALKGVESVEVFSFPGAVGCSTSAGRWAGGDSSQIEVEDLEGGGDLDCADPPQTAVGRDLAALVRPGNEAEAELIASLPSEIWDAMAAREPRYWDPSDNPKLAEEDVEDESSFDTDGTVGHCVGCGESLERLSFFVDGLYEQGGTVDCGSYGVTQSSDTWGRMCADCYREGVGVEIGTWGAYLYGKEATGRWRLLAGFDE